MPFIKKQTATEKPFTAVVMTQEERYIVYAYRLGVVVTAVVTEERPGNQRLYSCVGTAVCRRGDVFDMAKGVRLAVKRALCIGERGDPWATYSCLLSDDAARMIYSSVRSILRQQAGALDGDVIVTLRDRQGRNQKGMQK